MRTVSFAWMLVVLLVAGLAAAVACYLATPYVLVTTSTGPVLRVHRISGNVEILGWRDRDIPWTPIREIKVSDQLVSGEQLRLLELDVAGPSDSAVLYNGSPLWITEVTIEVTDGKSNSTRTGRKYVLKPSKPVHPMTSCNLEQPDYGQLRNDGGWKCRLVSARGYLESH